MVPTYTMHHERCFSLLQIHTARQRNSELDYGGRLQKRICSKLSVTQDPSGYWEMNREMVRTKLTRKRNNVTEAIRKKMTGKLSMQPAKMC
jgi:hypothetical protein